MGIDEEWNERLRILEDARQLKRCAAFFVHPEAPILVDGTGCARCYFDRPSAPDRMSPEEAEEQALVLNELLALKKLAVDYMHPEAGVQVDATASARCYFDRPSAPERLSEEDADERAAIIEETLALKKLATDYMHPEAPIHVNEFASARCYFDRPSAVERLSADEADERATIMKDLAALKKLAVDYMHPEAPIQTDGTECARCFFSRHAAPEYLSTEDADEHARIMEEAAVLKNLAVAYMHPEAPIQTDGTAMARCYFDRPSASERFEPDEAVERARVLEDAAALKSLAVAYMHPEAPIQVDATASARCYFDRPSAPEFLSLEEEEERANILEQVAALKQFATHYMHPEAPIDADSTATARCYFDRPSAPEQLSLEEAEVQALVMEEAAALKKLAVAYMHPEAPIQVDGTASARCYFDRFSAPERVSPEESDERAQVMEDLAALKQLALDYMHPESPLRVDGTASARCYYDRPSAPERLSSDEAEELTRVMEDIVSLKKMAIAYMHPEIGVVTEDPAAFGRNYFSRKAARGHYHMIHTFPALADDETEHHEHLDHFGMDDEMEGVFDDMRHQLHLPHDERNHDTDNLNKNQQQQQDSEEEGKLSRSPSSVMLFTEESIYD